MTNGFMPYKNAIRVKKYSMGRIGASHWVKHWIKMGLFFNDAGTQKGKWLKWSFCDVLWGKLVLKLRLYSLPLDDIRAIRNCIDNNFASPDCPDGFVNLVSFALIRKKTDIIICKKTATDYITDIIINGVSFTGNNGTCTFESRLELSVNGLLRDFIIDFDAAGNETAHMDDLLKFQLLQEHEAMLLLQLRKGLVKQIQADGSGRIKIMKPLSVEAYVNMVLQDQYNIISYVNDNGVELSFTKKQAETGTITEKQFSGFPDMKIQGADKHTFDPEID